MLLILILVMVLILILILGLGPEIWNGNIIIKSEKLTKSDSLQFKVKNVI
jgi:hypothetical protein